MTGIFEIINALCWVVRDIANYPHNLLLVEIYEIRLALDKRDFRHFRVIGGVPARSETQVTLHHDGLLGTVVILQYDMLVEHSATLPSDKEINSRSQSVISSDHPTVCLLTTFVIIQL